MKTGKLRIAIVGGLALLCFVCVAAAVVNGEKEVNNTGLANKQAADSALLKVVVSEITERVYEDWGSYSAELRGGEDASLSAPYQGGRVNSLAPVGARVRAGQALCDIDSVRYGAALMAAVAQTKLAQGDLERTKVNVEKGSLGRSALDAAELAFQNARMMEAAAERAYEDCRCEAPFDGVIVSRSIEKYQAALPGSPTLRIARMDRIEVIIALPETEAFACKPGMAAEFRLLQRPDRVYKGKVTDLDLAVERRSGTVTARIVVINDDSGLKPGMVGRARLLKRIIDRAVVVPASSLLHRESGVAAMVAENGVARERKVSIGASLGDSALVTEGLEAGDKLIISGAFQASNGARVAY